MNRREHLLVILMEECAELAKVASKSLRFGLDDHGYGEANEVLLHKEFNDLVAVADMLLVDGVGIRLDHDLVQGKEAKVEHYLEYSRLRGTLSDE